MKMAPHKRFPLLTLPLSEVCASLQQPRVGYTDPVGCAFMSSIAESLNSKQQRSWERPKSLYRVVLEEEMLTLTRRGGSTDSIILPENTRAEIMFRWGPEWQT